MGRLAGIIQHKYRFLIGEVGLAVNWILLIHHEDAKDPKFPLKVSWFFKEIKLRASAKGPLQPEK